MRQCYVYIVASKTAVLYVGMTNDLERRIYEHKQKLVPGFTAKYNVNILVFYDVFPTAIEAIEAEKKIKGWTRAKKIALIESLNPTWRDLAEDFCDTTDATNKSNRHPERYSAKNLGGQVTPASTPRSFAEYR
jgi:putative endonuclease